MSGSFSMDHAEALLSLFASNNPKVTREIPEFIRKRQDLPYTDEDIVTIDRGQLHEFIRRFIPTSHAKTSKWLEPILKLRKSRRSDVESFGDQIQIIPVACIHDATRIVMLELNHETRYVDGYRKGTLTYPQGHARFSALVDKFAIEESPATGKFWSPSSVDQILRHEIYREISEEITVESEYYKFLMMRDIGDCLFRGTNAAQIHPIYVNRAGTTGRHLAMLYDIDLSHSEVFSGQAELLVSNEPEKHTVRVVTINDLMQLESIDMLCTWVASSFSMLPFMECSFIQPFLKSL